MSGVTYLTQEDFDKIQAEVDVLKTVERKKAAAAIAEAREKGDLSENAEYDAAKDAQGMLELKISTLEMKLATAKIVNTDDIDTSKVVMLCKVKIKNLKMKKEFVYEIVSESAANLKQLKISITSPIAKGLLGKKVGDVAEIQTPGGLQKLEILDIFI